MNEERKENFFVELLKFILIALAIVIPVRLFIAQPFIVSGASMEPTFHTGEYLIIDELSYRFHEPQRDDVIIFRYPRNPSEFFIKRVIGLPGETVHISNDSVSITEQNGTTTVLSEPYLVNRGNGADQTVTLGSDQYFVMGDNRPDSSDSRYWGPVPASDLIGHVMLRLLPVSSLGLWPGSVTSGK
ncbi:MAG TPA: signal peptidase I [Candidatus Paceibacterota bacterium]